MDDDKTPAPDSVAGFIADTPQRWKKYLETWISRPAFRQALRRRDQRQSAASARSTGLDE